jgi:hypothetical protein
MILMAGIALKLALVFFRAVYILVKFQYIMKLRQAAA